MCSFSLIHWHIYCILDVYIHHKLLSVSQLNVRDLMCHYFYVHVHLYCVNNWNYKSEQITSRFVRFMKLCFIMQSINPICRFKQFREHMIIVTCKTTYVVYVTLSTPSTDQLRIYILTWIHWIRVHIISTLPWSDVKVRVKLSGLLNMSKNQHVPDHTLIVTYRSGGIDFSYSRCSKNQTWQLFFLIANIACVFL